jgi:hypothetical protein
MHNRYVDTICRTCGATKKRRYSMLKSWGGNCQSCAGKEAQLTQDRSTYRPRGMALQPHNTTTVKCKRCGFEFQQRDDYLARWQGHCRHCCNQLKRRYAVDKDAFKVLTPQTAYVLGFILADGCIDQSLQRLSIQIIDRELLVAIRDILGSTAPIRKAPYNPLETRPCFVLNIHSVDVVANLLALGITPKKSLTCTLPPISDKLFFHFLRGYFDGDGCIVVRKHFVGATMSMASGSPVLLEQISNRLSQLLGIKYASVKLSHGNCYTLTYQAVGAMTVADAMYNNANGLFLQRKHIRFVEARQRRAASPRLLAG